MGTCEARTESGEVGAVAMREASSNVVVFVCSSARPRGTRRIDPIPIRHAGCRAGSSSRAESVRSGRGHGRGASRFLTWRRLGNPERSAMIENVEGIRRQTSKSSSIAVFGIFPFAFVLVKFDIAKDLSLGRRVLIFIVVSTELPRNGVHIVK